MATRLCERGCGRPHRARGLCSTCYNQEHQPNRHPKIQVPCSWCGKTCMKDASQPNRYADLYCSYTCRDDMRAYRARPDHPRLVTVLANRLPVLYMAPPHPEPQRRPRIAWVAGYCRRCGKPFVDRWLAAASSQCCSPNCSTRLAKHRRRATKKAAFVQPVSPARIYARDSWRCQLCGRKVRRNAVVPHPLAPVLDHIIPLAAGVEAGGVHAPHNVQCAHYRCNNLKGAKLLTTQLMLFG